MVSAIPWSELSNFVQPQRSKNRSRPGCQSERQRFRTPKYRRHFSLVAIATVPPTSCRRGGGECSEIGSRLSSVPGACRTWGQTRRRSSPGSSASTPCPTPCWARMQDHHRADCGVGLRRVCDPGQSEPVSGRRFFCPNCRSTPGGAPAGQKTPTRKNCGRLVASTRALGSAADLW
jgi:hypothetical protein